VEKLLKELAEKIKGMSIKDLESLKNKMSDVFNMSDWGSDTMEGEIARWISVAQENKMPDSNFLWLKTDKAGNKANDRKLPYKYPDGKLSRSGLRGAWAVLHGARGGVDLAGGPGKEATLAKCRRAIGSYNRKNPDDKITISEKSDKGGESMKYLKRDVVVDLLKGVGLDDNKQEQVIASMDNLVDEALKGATATIKNTWYKPETHKRKVDEAVASAKKIWEKEQKDLAEKKKKDEVKFAERAKAVSAAGFMMTDYRENLVRKMTIDEAGEKEFNAFLADLKKTQIKASTASKKGKTFKPEMSGGTQKSVELAI